MNFFFVYRLNIKLFLGINLLLLGNYSVVAQSTIERIKMEINQPFKNRKYKEVVYLYHQYKNVIDSNKYQQAEILKMVGTSCFYLSNLDSAFYYYEKAYDIICSTDNLDSFKISLLINKGLVKSRQFFYKEAEEFYIEALSLINKTRKNPYPQIYSQLGALYQKTNKIDLAKKYLKKSVLIDNKCDSSGLYLINPLLNLGNLYRKTGEYNFAINLESQALQILEEYKGGYLDKWYIINYNLGISLSKNQEYKKALDQFYLCKELIESFPDDVNPDPDLFNNLALAYRNLHQHDSANHYFMIALSTAQPNSLSQIRAFQNYANFLFLNPKLKSLGRIYYDSAFRLLVKKYGSYHPKLMEIYTCLGDACSLTNNSDSSLLYYQSALKCIDTSLNIKDASSFISKEFSPDLLVLNILKRKSNLLFHQFNTSKDKTSKIYIAEQISSIVMRYNTVYKELLYSKVLFSDKVSQLILDIKNINLIGIEALYYLSFENDKMNYFSKALQFSESSKSLILQTALNENVIDNKSKPSVLLSSQIEKEIADLNKQIRLLRSVEPNFLKQAEILHLRLKILNLVFEKDSVLKSQKFLMNVREHLLDSIFSTSLNYQLNHRTSSTISEFFIIDSAMHVFTISNNKRNWRKINFSDSLKAHVYTILEYFNYFPSRESSVSRDQFIKSSSLLYPILFDTLFRNTKDYIVIPDGLLSQFPFDILLTNYVNNITHNFKSLPYLIKKTNISYSFSISLLSKALNTMNDNLTMVVLAPDFNDKSISNQVTPIRERNYEVDGILELFPTAKIIHNIPNKLDSLEYLINGYSIIHLATHTYINDRLPFQSSILLHDKDSKNSTSIKLADILSMDINNIKMAVLNSCNTGVGDFINGEGIISFAWAFNYMGCPSIVMNLNEIDDYSAMKIITNYYKYLKDGHTKSAALRKSKLDYLNTATPIKSNPKFWSPISIIGNPQPLFSDSNSNYEFVILIIFIIVGFYLMGKRLKLF